jgi:hypothetical protein
MPKRPRRAEPEDDGQLVLTSSAPRRGPKALREARARYREVYQLHVELKDIQPGIWRRLLVPGGFTLHELHGLLQDAMGWEDYHLYEFTTKHARFAEPDPDDDDYGRFVHDSRVVLLGDLKLWRGSSLVYLYDFGDGWEHAITVETIGAPDPLQPVPACLDGARACPREDSGGSSGYERMLASLADPDDDEHESFREWAGAHFDPERFSAELVNRDLLRAQGVWRKRLAEPPASS